MSSAGRTLPSIALSVVLLGIGDAMANSYMVLFAADEAQLSPLQVGLLASATGVGGIVISSWLGRRFDRRPTRAYIVAVMLLGAVGFVAELRPGLSGAAPALPPLPQRTSTKATTARRGQQ